MTEAIKPIVFAPIVPAITPPPPPIKQGYVAVYGNIIKETNKAILLTVKRQPTDAHKEAIWIPRSQISKIICSSTGIPFTDCIHVAAWIMEKRS